MIGFSLGEANVRKTILETGSRDAWKLIRRGYEGSKNYLAKVMVAVIIFRNPEVLD